MVNLLLSSLAGLLLSGAFEPIGKWWLAPIALTVHMYAIDRTNRKLLSTFIFAFTFNSVLLHWTSTYVGSTPWIILSVGLSSLYLPLALVGRWGIAAYPLIFVVLEEIRNRFPFGGFGWARVAYSQADAPYANIASRGGAISLSGITVLIAAFVYCAVNKRIIFIFLVPFFALVIPNNISTVGQTSVLMIQGNVPELGLDFNARAKQVFYNHLNETKLALAQGKKVDFIVWPENAVDVDPYTNKDVYEQLESFDKPLIIGAITGKGEKLLNTSILWGDKTQDIYVKQHLTPFGEYMPLRFIAKKISPFVNQVDDFYPGNRQKIFTIGQAKVAPVICFELLDDEILANAAKSSNLLVVQTNSATFGTSAESAQQLSITRIRAIEHSRNVVSVSTTGISAIIDFNGKILRQTSMGTTDHVFADVGLIEHSSPRDRYGDWAGIFTLIWLLVVARRAYI
ncbi:MAG: apolipoprotein N-acyltransferase [Actinomycetes bacterium]